LRKVETEKNSEGTKVVSFSLNTLRYAVDIDRIQEIVYFKPPTPLPQTSSFVEGVLDLRGLIIPVIDLKKKIGLESKGNLSPDYILIIKMEQKMCGFIVDEVHEIMTLPQGSVQRPEQFDQGVVSKCLSGIAKIKEELVLLLNLDSILTEDEQQILEKVQ